jgi:hypothetical protein
MRNAIPSAARSISDALRSEPATHAAYTRSVVAPPPP